MAETGKRLSHYHLTQKIGQGGMGEVWQATDTRLDRQVAVKLLPEAVTGDATRLDRFAREAKLLASLNHPGIATIHDVDQHDGLRFLVMELVPGEDLAQVLERGPLPLADALDVAIQILKALEAAHSQGVVHRDLKPANVKRDPAGQIKVLDFGLAKAMSTDTSSEDPDTSTTPTVTSAGTMAGAIMGTAAYMSPEQARGRPVDKRTDIWSFGVLLYELLTGSNPFRGETVADSVGAIMHRSPDLDALPPQTPTAIRRVLRRCLTRERSRRLHDIADARIEIEDAIANPEAEPKGTAAEATRPRSGTPWVALAVLLPVAVATAWWLGSRTPSAAPAPTRQFILAHDLEVEEVDLSPAGTHIAYRVDRDLYLHALDSLESRHLLTLDSGQGDTFWSPDGRSLGFASTAGVVQRIDLVGGTPVTLASTDAVILQAKWSEDGHIYFSQPQGSIARIPAAGGAEDTFMGGQENMIDYHGWDVLPGGQGLITIPHLDGIESNQIFIEQPGEEPRLIFKSDSELTGVTYSTTGHLLFHREENPRGLWAIAFSLSEQEVREAPFLVVPDLQTASLSNSGDMIYSRSALESGRRIRNMIRTDRSGTITDRLDIPIYEESTFALSPDGSKLALLARGVGRPSGDKANLWVIDLQRGTTTRLTESGVSSSKPIWMADGSRVAFFTDSVTLGEEKKVISVRADGTGDPQTLFESDITFFLSMTQDWSQATFVRGEMSSDDGLDLWVLEPENPSSERLFAGGPGHQILPSIHPSGKWLAYLSGKPLNWDIIIRPFPEGSGQWKAAIDASYIAGWSPKGDYLYYETIKDGKDYLMEVAFDDAGPQPVFGRPVELFNAPDSFTFTAVVQRDQFAFVVNKEPEDGEENVKTDGIILVENWLSRFAQ